MRTIGVTLLIAALTIGLGACTSGSPAPASPSPGAPVSDEPSPSSEVTAPTSPSDEPSPSAPTSEPLQSFSISTPSGEASLSLDGALPSGWPTDFPLPPGAAPAGSGSLSGSSAGVMVGVFSTEGAGKDAYDFYADQSSLEPTESKSVGREERFVGSMKVGGTHPGSVTVASLRGTTHVVVILDAND